MGGESREIIVFSSERISNIEGEDGSWGGRGGGVGGREGQT